MPEDQLPLLTKKYRQHFKEKRMHIDSFHSIRYSPLSTFFIGYARPPILLFLKVCVGSFPEPLHVRLTVDDLIQEQEQHQL
jgi:hypothetical protein